ncbi:nucleoside triphosphate pyrophosphatase [Galactobacter sp.]|uniref:Maf family protein n=1 Tax=Galactobacter sp. TaxID=2676125 RepID=UPI0025C3983E|nr:nucleoside triphosphate pyrophosphatase [Galactobacter sp.]
MTSPLLLLASTSGSRRSVLDATGFAYATDAPDVDERALIAEHRSAGEDISPAREAGLLAQAKAQDVAARPGSAGHLVLGCDSVFELDGAAYGKPHVPEVAIERWRQMRGRTGVLHTGHTLVDLRDGAESAGASVTVSTSVTFADASDEEIAAYVATGEPLGCAGGFTVDGKAAALVERIDGDFHAVVGISPNALRELCAQLGVAVTELWS